MTEKEADKAISDGGFHRDIIVDGKRRPERPWSKLWNRYESWLAKQKKS